MVLMQRQVGQKEALLRMLATKISFQFVIGTTGEELSTRLQTWDMYCN